MPVVALVQHSEALTVIRRLWSKELYVETPSGRLDFHSFNQARKYAAEQGFRGIKVEYPG